MKTLTPLMALVAVVGIVGGAGFSACNKKTEGPSGTAATGAAAPQGGLMIEEVKAGEGAVATKGKTMSVHYTGWLTNGTKFDSSLDRGQPIEFMWARAW